MTTDQILSLGPQLADFLGEFADCFSRSEPRGHLERYVRGQLSDLPRKTAAPIADFTEVPRRTLQGFLSWSEWDHRHMRDRVQEIVVRDHADWQAIGIIDDSGHPKSGGKTAGVQRQWCGNTGKVDNCVVSVHLSCARWDTQCRAMLDSALYLPENWATDPERRAEARIPDDVTFQPKYRIALEQLRRARENGISFAWMTFDEWYAMMPEFLDGLAAMGQRYVAEVRRSLHGWMADPRENPRVRYSRVDHLCRFSRVMMRQAWQRVYLKETGKGPMVWEVKVAPFWIQRDGGVLGPYWLVHARNLLDPREEKYFLANASAGTPLEAILHVAFARWPIERCLEDAKDELGMSHFEIRKYDAVLRHLSVTQVSHLFLARQTERLRGEKSGDHAVPSPHSRQRAHRRPAAAPPRAPAPPGTHGRQPDSNPKSKPPRPRLTPQEPHAPARTSWNQPGRDPMLSTSLRNK